MRPAWPLKPSDISPGCRGVGKQAREGLLSLKGWDKGRNVRFMAGLFQGERVEVVTHLELWPPLGAVGAGQVPPTGPGEIIRLVSPPAAGGPVWILPH